MSSQDNGNVILQTVEMQMIYELGVFLLSLIQESPVTGQLTVPGETLTVCLWL